MSKFLFKCSHLNFHSRSQEVTGNRNSSCKSLPKANVKSNFINQINGIIPGIRQKYDLIIPKTMYLVQDLQTRLEFHATSASRPEIVLPDYSKSTNHHRQTTLATISLAPGLTMSTSNQESVDKQSAGIDTIKTLDIYRETTEIVTTKLATTSSETTGSILSTPTLDTAYDKSSVDNLLSTSDQKIKTEKISKFSKTNSTDIVTSGWETTSTVWSESVSNGTSQIVSTSKNHGDQVLVTQQTIETETTLLSMEQVTKSKISDGINLDNLKEPKTATEGQTLSESVSQNILADATSTYYDFGTMIMSSEGSSRESATMDQTTSIPVILEQTTSHLLTQEEIESISLLTEKERVTGTIGSESTPDATHSINIQDNTPENLVTLEISTEELISTDITQITTFKIESSTSPITTKVLNIDQPPSFPIATTTNVIIKTSNAIALSTPVYYKALTNITSEKLRAGFEFAQTLLYEPNISNWKWRSTDPKIEKGWNTVNLVISKIIMLRAFQQ